MRNLRTTLITLALFLTIALVWRYWPRSGQKPPSEPSAAAEAEPDEEFTVAPKFRPAPRERVNGLDGFLAHERDDPSVDNPLARAKERILRFKSQADYQKFLSAARRAGLEILGRNSRLLAVLVGYQRLSDLERLSRDAESSLNFIVVAPDPGTAGAQPEAAGFGVSGVTSVAGTLDRSGWGKGVKVAVLDTGVAPHSVLNEVITLDLGGLDGQINGHGTAVASIIAGNNPVTPGIAPDAEIIGIRIADSLGQSNSFLLAEGILTAVDQGAQVINVSMGSYGDASVVADAVAYAKDRGAVIVASAGNEGLDNLAYPAAYPDVISVGAIDAAGAHLDFSNQSAQLSTSAPGYEVNAAWPDEQVISFSGTSAAAPFVSGSIAALMSQDPRISASQAADLLLQHSNEAGILGSDPQFGTGVLDVARAMQADVPNITDPAIASAYYAAPGQGSANGSTTILIENRGTLTLGNVPVQVSLNDRQRDYFINQLKPGDVKAIQIPTDHARSTALGELAIDARILPSESIRDQRIDNNARNVVLDLSSPQQP